MTPRYKTLVSGKLESRAKTLAHRLRLGACVLALALGGCGPIKRMPANHFFFTVHNNDSFPARVRCQSWFDSRIVTSYEADIYPGNKYTFDLGQYTPDGVEIKTVAWQTSWGKPDYGDCYMFHVDYPQWTNTRKEYFHE